MSVDHQRVRRIMRHLEDELVMITGMIAIDVASKHSDAHDACQLSYAQLSLTNAIGELAVIIEYDKGR